jgi:hypothetical protein
MPFIVATYVYASSQGQRTPSLGPIFESYQFIEITWETYLARFIDLFDTEKP